MLRLCTLAIALTLLTLVLPFPAPAWATGCSPDAVQVGPTCVDKYEASVWSIPATQTRLIHKVKRGTATLADLTAGGATQVSLSAPSGPCLPTFPATFPNTGNWTAPLYAVSIPGVYPTACVTWFQAEQACAISGKRLLTNQEWQRAVAGTPDPDATPSGADCNTNSASPDLTKARTNCVSTFGAFDMVGNIYEWVADWVPRSTTCVTDLFGTGDANCLAGASTTGGPGVVLRGGNWGSHTTAGVFTVDGSDVPSTQHFAIGFRCAR